MRIPMLFSALDCLRLHKKYSKFPGRLPAAGIKFPEYMESEFTGILVSHTAEQEILCQRPKHDHHAGAHCYDPSKAF